MRGSVLGTIVGILPGFIASLWFANFLGFALATAGVKPLTQLLPLSTPAMSAFILATGFVGAYALNNNMVNIWIAFFFGVVGYIMRRVDLPLAPLILGLVLSPLAEKSFRQSLALSRGDPAIFFTRPISAALLSVGLAVSLCPYFGAWSSEHTAREETHESPREAEKTGNPLGDNGSRRHHFERGRCDSLGGGGLFRDGPGAYRP